MAEKLSVEDKEILDKRLIGFMPRDLAVAYNVLNTIAIDMYPDPEKFMTWYESFNADRLKVFYQKEQKNIDKTIAKLPKCPECQTPMRIYPVNISKCTRCGPKEIKSQWQCPNCGYDMYSLQSVNEELQLKGIK